MPTKVLLDTDIGTDIDDAVCLAYLLSQPRCDLLGITTVTGEAEQRAMIASAICKAAGKNIPIYPGVEQPLLIPQYQPKAQQAKALARWDHDTAFPHGEAIEFLRHTIRQHPGEIVLLTIGPLTNIGLLFASDPEIPHLLKGLVMMCGLFSNRMAGVGPREWNALGDPHATAIVYRAPVPLHRSVGIDVTAQAYMDAAQVRERFRATLLQPVLDFAAVWFEESPGLTFHDPLAAAVIFDEHLCHFQKGAVNVEVLSDHVAGMTHWTPDRPDAPHEVAVDVDRTAFFEHYFSVVR
jgi:inosine-uridine nucleoside N-ribohydrolase